MLYCCLLEQHTPPWNHKSCFSKVEQVRCEKWSWRGGAKEVFYIPRRGARKRNIRLGFRSFESHHIADVSDILEDKGENTILMQACWLHFGEKNENTTPICCHLADFLKQPNSPSRANHSVFRKQRREV
jgi:hypothetical protein